MLHFKVHHDVKVSRPGKCAGSGDQLKGLGVDLLCPPGHDAIEKWGPKRVWRIYFGEKKHLAQQCTSNVDVEDQQLGKVAWSHLD